MAITINGSGTIGGVSVGGLPDGIVDTDMLASAAVTSAKVGSLGTSNLPAGSVLQVVQSSYATNVQITTSTYTSTGLTASITPSSASNKILVLANVNVYYGSQNNIIFGMRINRAGSYPWTNYYFNNVGSVVNLMNPYGINYLDSPSTTSSTTYTIEFNTTSGASIYSYPNAQYAPGGNQSQSTMTLMEIAG